MASVQASPPTNTTRLADGSKTIDANQRAGGAGDDVTCDQPAPSNVQVSPHALVLHAPVPPNSTTRLRTGSNTIEASDRAGGAGVEVTCDQRDPSKVQVSAQVPHEPCPPKST